MKFGVQRLLRSEPWHRGFHAHPREVFKAALLANAAAFVSLPEHAVIEDAIERLCFIAKIEEGLRQSEAGQLVSHDEVKKQFLS